MTTLSDDIPRGTRLGRFITGDFVASGGNAAVYACADQKSDLNDPASYRYAAKVVKPHEDPERFRKRSRLFEHELKTLKHLSGNIHIVTVFDDGVYVDEEGRERPFGILQQLSGGTLAVKVKSRPLREEEATLVAIGLTDALGYAHHHNVLHCDVKPDNVMLDESGNPVWIDFGIAKVLDADGNEVSIMSEAGSVAVGTPPFMSPEHFLGRHAVSEQSDLWSMGVLLVQMMTGVCPFGQNFESVRQRTAIQSWNALEQLPEFKEIPLLPPVSRKMRAIILNCLQVSLDDRYQTAQQLRADLTSHLKGEPLIHASEEDVVVPIEGELAEGASGHIGRLVLAAALIGLIAGVAIWALFLRSNPVQESPPDLTEEIRPEQPADAKNVPIDTSSEPATDTPEANLGAKEIIPARSPEPNDIKQPMNEPATQRPVQAVAVRVRLGPNSGYDPNRVFVNNVKIDPRTGLSVKLFDAKGGQRFKWKITDTDNQIVDRSVVIPTDLQPGQVLTINWKTAQIRSVSS